MALTPASVASAPQTSRRSTRNPAGAHVARGFAVAFAHDFFDLTSGMALSYWQAQVMSSGRIALLRVQHSANRKPTISWSAWVLAV